MSIGAHRITKFEYEYSFSIGELLKYFDINMLNSNDSGIIEITFEELEKALKDEDIRKETKQAIRDDIKTAEAKGDDYVSYYCF